MRTVKNSATATLESLLQPLKLGLNEHLIPTMTDFKKLASVMPQTQKRTLAIALNVKTVGDLSAESGQSIEELHKLFRDEDFAKAVLFGKLLAMKNGNAQQLYLAELIRRERGADTYEEQLEQMVIEPRHYIQQLGKQINASGDGKRQLLKELIGYGMQAKMVEPGYHDLETGVRCDPVYAMADPKIALSALQELNKMDHEYAESDGPISSTETQADRIRRLQADAKAIKQEFHKQVRSLSKEKVSGSN